MQRRLTDYIIVLFKGIAMGAADVVPGVSGGTIAFISGIYEELLESIDNVDNQLKTKEILGWIQDQFPSLVPKIAWNQPMFTDHETYIIGFSVSKKHLAIAPEQEVVELFSKEIKNAGYDHTKMLIRIPWNMDIDKSLLKKIIEYNIESKKECKSFWR